MIRFASAFVALLALCPLRSSADLEWVKSSQTFQATLQDTSISAVYAFTNTGAEAVAIRDVKTSCGCTAAKPDKTIYAPGDGGEIRAVFTIGARVGRNTKKINVLSSDPGRPVKALELVVEIPELVRPSRRLVYWRAGQAIKDEVVSLRAMSKHEAKLFGVRSSTTNLLVSTEVVTPGRQIDLKIRPQSVDKPFNERVQVDVKAADGSAQRSYVIFCRVLPAPGATRPPVRANVPRYQP